MPDKRVQIAPPPRARAWAPPTFVCVWEWEGVRAAWITATGELDVHTAPALAASLTEAQRDSRLVVLDLSGVTFMAIAGLQVIEAATRDALRAGARLVLTRGPRQVHSVFTLTHMDQTVAFVDAD